MKSFFPKPSLEIALGLEEGVEEIMLREAVLASQDTGTLYGVCLSTIGDDNSLQVQDHNLSIRLTISRCSMEVSPSCLSAGFRRRRRCRKCRRLLQYGNNTPLPRNMHDTHSNSLARAANLLISKSERVHDYENDSNTAYPRTWCLTATSLLFLIARDMHCRCSQSDAIKLSCPFVS